MLAIRCMKGIAGLPDHSKLAPTVLAVCARTLSGNHPQAGQLALIRLQFVKHLCVTDFVLKLLSILKKVWIQSIQ